ncbi:MAG TPA: Ig-like domain-containing protein [Micromonosporaceae bacterium]|jgi:lipoprotein-anchoring transpeptidase ErfK/SrfK|nr:Ig-like domain-containing protein [Micromonosporaceae bacterium]
MIISVTTRFSRGRRRAGIAVVALVSALLAGCGSPTATWQDPGDPATGGGPADPVAVAITSPNPKAGNVPTSAEIGVKVTGAEKTEVALTSAGGQRVPGAFRADGSTWIPGRQLAYGTTYTVTVTGINKAGDRATKSSTFTTMRQPGLIMGAGLYLFDDQTVGVGMPVVVEFTRAVRDKDRAAIEKRLFVTSEPAVEGSWHWFSDSQAHYRPKDYWKPGTRLSVRIAIGGFPFGKGWYGRRDRVARNVTVGEDLRLEVDNTTKKLSVIRDGQVIRTMPVSLGKPSSPSSSGNLVVMEKKETAMFDSSTYGVPVSSADGYRTEVRYAMRLTWGGEFIHAAPWSVADQGRRNVSHGCVNVSTENARYLFRLAKIGTPVAVKSTETHVGKGDGWTGWDLSWDDYRAGSALI